MPPTSRSHRASSAPAVPSIDGHAHNNRHIEPGELCVGCITWLAQKVPSAGSIKCTKAGCCAEELDDGGYEHPVVVLSIKQKEGSHVLGDLICTVAIVTTFSSTSLQRYLKKRRHAKNLQESIPIRDSTLPLPEVPEAKTTEAIEYLDIENGALHKQSYVKLQHIYEIPASTLRQYKSQARRAYSLRLQQASYEFLIGKLDLEAQTFVPTSQLKSTRESRLKSLAGVPATRPTSTISPPSASPALPPNPRPHRSALQFGTMPASAWTQPLPTPSRMQPVHYPTTPNTAAHLPSNPPNTIYPPTNLYSQSTYYGTISSSIPTYQRPVQAPNYTPPEPTYNEDSGEGSTFLTLVVVVVVGALLYWKFW